MPEKTAADVELFTRMVAGKQGWTTSPDTAFYGDLCEGLKVNWNRYGYFLCPCRDTGGSREADREIVCPCIYAKADIAEHGHCFCSLYWSPEAAASGVAASGIPDRAAR